MTLSEINKMKEELAEKQQEVAKLEKQIKREELNNQMNAIERQKMENFAVINKLREILSDDEDSEAVIAKLQKKNDKLEAEWQAIYKVYFYL